MTIPTALEVRSPRVLVACPYLEGSCIALVRQLDSLGFLARFVTTLAFAVPDPPARDALASRPNIALGLAQRRQIRGMSPRRLAHVGLLPELLHLALRRTGPTSALASRAMYWSKVRFDSATARLLRRWPPTNRPDVVLGVFGSASRTFEQAHAYGIPTVLHFVNSHPTVHNQFLRSFAKLPDGHHEMVPTWVAHRVDREVALADLILVPSAFVADQLGQIGVNAGRMTVIPYGVDITLFTPAATFEPEPSERLRVLFVGQISYRKGIPTLIEAARATEGFAEFNMIGPVVSGDLLRSLPPNLHYRGSTDSKDVARRMRESDVLVLPSYEDAYGLVVLEAMASGLPAIVTRNVGTAELIDEGKTGYVVSPGESAPIVRVLELLRADRTLGRRVGLAARSNVVTRASWKHYGARAVDAITALQRSAKAS